MTIHPDLINLDTNPSYAFERRVAEMAVAMAEVVLSDIKNITMQEHLSERGFTLVEMKDMHAQAALCMKAFIRAEFFTPALTAAKKRRV